MKRSGTSRTSQKLIQRRTRTIDQRRPTKQWSLRLPPDWSAGRLTASFTVNTRQRSLRLPPDWSAGRLTASFTVDTRQRSLRLPPRLVSWQTDRLLHCGHKTAVTEAPPRLVSWQTDRLLHCQHKTAVTEPTDWSAGRLTASFTVDTRQWSLRLLIGQERP